MIARREEYLATKDASDALLIPDFLWQRSSKTPVRPLRLLITLHKITFTFESLFQLQLWNSAGFNHFFNHLDQNRNFPSCEKFPICSLIVRVYYKQKRGFFECWKSSLWKMRQMSFPLQDWTFNKSGFVCFITFPYLIAFLFWLIFFSIAQHAFGNDYLKMEKKILSEFLKPVVVWCPFY